MNNLFVKSNNSFRDPAGFIFWYNDSLYRQINKSYTENYRQLIDSGLYKRLVDEDLLVPHLEVTDISFIDSDGYKIIKPNYLPFISYPYEWSFDQLKDAALLTLKIQFLALEYNMSLKDATAYNVQFLDGAPIFIDTLSFEIYPAGKTWVAYNQYCRHFLAPLALMHYTDVRLSALLKNYLEGIPIDLASAILPFRSRFSFTIFMHIYLHARSQKYHIGSEKVEPKQLPLNRLVHLLNNLSDGIKRLKIKKRQTEWSAYYDNTNYSSIAKEDKAGIISLFIKKAAPKTAWDFGGNNGLYSRLASNESIKTISFDIDEIAVNNSYQQLKANGERNIFPLVMSLVNPSGGMGWANTERSGLLERGPVDLILVLAFIHHLVISNNIPFDNIASYFSKLCDWLIIEFVPESDSQVQLLIRNRPAVANRYSQSAFEQAFGTYFLIDESKKIDESGTNTLFVEK